MFLVVVEESMGFGNIAIESVNVVGKNSPLLYNSSSLVSVAYSAFGLSTMASTGHDSWQKPQ